jgi:hypothetical protein
VREPRGTLFPVAVEGAESLPFDWAAKQTGYLLEQMGLPRVNGNDRAALESKLREFVLGSRGAAGELERRLNGTAEPLVSASGGLDSYDCLAVGHELRRLRGARGALVIAMDSEGHLSIGLAVEEGSTMDVLGNELIEALDSVITKRGWKSPDVRDVSMEFVVDKEGSLKS